MSQRTPAFRNHLERGAILAGQVDKGIGEDLVAAGLVTAADVERLRALQATSGHYLTDLLIDQGLITESALLRFYATRLQTRFVPAAKLEQAKFQDEALEKLSADSAGDLGVLPMWYEGATGALHAVAAVPLDPGRIARARELAQVSEIVTYLTTWSALRAAIQKHYYRDATAFEVLTEFGVGPPPRKPVTEQEARDSTQVKVTFGLEEIHRLRKENLRFRIAQEFHRRVGFERDIDVMIDRILTVGFDLLAADLAVVQLEDGTRVQRGQDRSAEVHVSPELLERARSSPEGMVIRDMEATAGGSRAVVAAQLVGSKSSLGILYMESRTPNAFDDEDLALLSAIAAQASSLIENAMLVRQIEREAEEHSRMQVVTDRMTSLGTLAAGMAHEINNPLAYVLGNLEIAIERINQGTADPSMLTALKRCVDGVERIEKIVADLQNFSRRDTTKMGPVDVGAAIETAVNMSVGELKFRAKLEREEVELPPAHANEHRLVQVLLNLLMNSAQALSEDTFNDNRVFIRTEAGPKGHVTIEISDNGPGIPEDIRESIFDPFFTTKPVGEGTGLGLSICRDIVTGFGGTLVLVESEQGACFRLVLPQEAD